MASSHPDSGNVYKKQSPTGKGETERVKEVFPLLFQVNKTYLQFHLLADLTFGYQRVLIFLAAETHPNVLQSSCLSDIHVGVN